MKVSLSKSPDTLFMLDLTSKKIQKLRVLFWVKGVIVPPTFLALFIWAVVRTHGGGPYVTNKFVVCQFPIQMFLDTTNLQDSLPAHI